MEKINPAIKAGFSKVSTSNQFAPKGKDWFDFHLAEDGGKEGKIWKRFHTLERSGDDRGRCRRADFLNELVKLVPINIARFGKRLVSLEDLGQEGLRLKFLDGTEAKHQAVIGCDGIKSITRQYVVGLGSPYTRAVFSKKYCYRGVIPMEKAAASLGHELAGNSQMYLNHHGHILTFPIAKGKLMNGRCKLQ